VLGRGAEVVEGLCKASSGGEVGRPAVGIRLIFGGRTDSMKDMGTAMCNDDDDDDDDD